MTNLIEFPKTPNFSPKPEQCETIPDCEANQNRDGQGPPIGTLAWCCRHDGCFAFYITPDAIKCYECHEEQYF